MPASARRSAPAALLALLTLTLAGCGGNLFNRIDNFWSLGCCGAVIVIMDIIALVEIAGSNRSFGDKVLWVLLIVFLPLLGLILYYFFGRS